jgi:serine protease Do
MARLFCALCICALLHAATGVAHAQDAGWLGLKVQAGAGMARDLKSGKKSTTPAEAKVTEVTADGPAATAGIKAGDVILSVDDRAIAGGKDLADVIRQKPPGSQVRVRVKRDGAEQDLSVVLGKRPAGKAQ